MPPIVELQPPIVPPQIEPALPAAWAAALQPDAALDATLDRLQHFLAAQHAAGRVIYPPAPQRFAALAHTAPGAVRAVILGQDPYHGPSQAHGLAFSVPLGQRRPPSLRNILRERDADLGLPDEGHGCLLHWAEGGVLLLNTALSVAAGQPGSHARAGWDVLTRAVLRHLNTSPTPIAFVLWGAHAGRYAEAIDNTDHLVLRSAHPSPLSAHAGFFGSRPFSRVNAFLTERGMAPIDWRLGQGPNAPPAGPAAAPAAMAAGRH